MDAKEKQVLNAMTVDLEDWFHVSVFRNIIDYRDWEKQQSRIIPNFCRLLNLFDEYGVKITFFVLGWIAERYPEIVLAIKNNGHEIGSHSYSHRLVFEMSKKEFAEDLDRSITVLESITKEKVWYYRAPSYSITRDSLWALELLCERGIQYDSSLFPIKHDLYGMTGIPRFPFRLTLKNGRELVEFPPSTLRLWGGNIPIAGGGYLRLFPFWFIKNGIQKLNQKGEPVIFYIHPWEFDPSQPRLDVDFFSRFRHYSNMEVSENRLRQLLSKFRFSSLGDAMKSYDIQSWPDSAANGNGMIRGR
jgi:polysaccharide deacetylase family protein (PEP-CTERM system associated)